MEIIINSVLPMVSRVPLSYAVNGFRAVSLPRVKGCLKDQGEDFPGVTVVKNPPANAGDTGSSSGSRRSHMPWSN